MDKPLLCRLLQAGKQVNEKDMDGNYSFKQEFVIVAIVFKVTYVVWSTKYPKQNIKSVTLSSVKHYGDFPVKTNRSELELSSLSVEKAAYKDHKIVHKTCTKYSDHLQTEMYVCMYVVTMTTPHAGCYCKVNLNVF